MAEIEIREIQPLSVHGRTSSRRSASMHVRYKDMNWRLSSPSLTLRIPAFAGRTEQRGPTLIPLRGDEYEICQLSYQKP